MGRTNQLHPFSSMRDGCNYVLMQSLPSVYARLGRLLRRHRRTLAHQTAAEQTGGASSSSLAATNPGPTCCTTPPVMLSYFCYCLCYCSLLPD
jgi:hypothetical protein